MRCVLERREWRYAITILEQNRGGVLLLTLLPQEWSTTSFALLLSPALDV